MAFHSQLTGADLHEPKGIESAAAGRVYVSNGSGSGSWEPYGGGGGSQNIVYPLWRYTNTSQLPSGTETPLKVNFGSAYNTASDAVQLFANGDIQINKQGLYVIKILLNIGRTSGSGDSVIFVWLTNGNDGSPRDRKVVRITEDNEPKTVELNFIRSLWPGAVINAWIARDGSGDDSGGIMAFNSSGGTVPNLPAAELQVGTSA